jgi:hypothetical protein
MPVSDQSTTIHHVDEMVPECETARSLSRRYADKGISAGV